MSMVSVMVLQQMLPSDVLSRVDVNSALLGGSGLGQEILDVLFNVVKALLVYYMGNHLSLIHI